MIPEHPPYTRSAAYCALYVAIYGTVASATMVLGLLATMAGGMASAGLNLGLSVVLWYLAVSAAFEYSSRNH
jgi:hypothetical protein